MAPKKSVSRVKPYTLRTRSSNLGGDVKIEESAEPLGLPAQTIVKTPDVDEQSDSSSFYLVKDDREISDDGMDSDGSSHNSERTWFEVLSSSEDELDEYPENHRSSKPRERGSTGSPRLKKARVARVQIKRCLPISKIPSERADVPKMRDAACQANLCCEGLPKSMKNAMTMTVSLSAVASRTSNRTSKNLSNGKQGIDDKQEKVTTTRSRKGQSIAKIAPQISDQRQIESNSPYSRKGALAYGRKESDGSSGRAYKRVSDLFSDVRDFYSASGPGYEDWKKRYQEEDGKVYLGEGVSIDSFRWWYLKALKRPASFLKQLAIEVWTEDEFANRSFEPESILPKNHIPGKPPPQMVEPHLLRLVLSVYYEYLCDDASLDENERMKYILKSTSALSSKMCQLRSEKCHGPIQRVRL
ncbi:hypothetical protein QAD02_004617 [Eretmocerus hayati]|uniref:Uncharacterized protein n=1 Tax=Eretmocerus hayati TaxID=131215 RepID=A0ACC2NQ81_9HYME|nr:hypothetical protein QAD02_004617 [Eretmocerus hayati]